MKLFEFYQPLLEYKRDITIQKLGDKLEAHAKSFDQINNTLTPDNIVDILEIMDPTPNKKYMMWIIKQYLAKQFRLEDAGRVKTLLATYTKAKPRLSADQKDINRFSFHQLDDLVDSWSDRVETDSTINTDNVKVLYNGPYGFLGIPETEEAACELGRGTKWCTAGRDNNMFDHYNRSGPLYVWIEKPGNKKYQLHFESTQFMDASDRPVPPKQISKWRNDHLILSKLFKKHEPTIATKPDAAYRYAKNVIGSRWPEAEPYIMKDPSPAYYYARDVIKDRWPEAEPYIMKDPDAAYSYAERVIKGRWPEAEEYILTDLIWATQYANNVINGEWPELEQLLVDEPGMALEYARGVNKGKWPEFEQYFIKSPQLSYFYASDVIKGRWPEAEPVIMQDPRWAYLYAHRVLGTRWPEAEPVIMQDPTWAENYQEFVRKLRRR